MERLLCRPVRFDAVQCVFIQRRYFSLGYHQCYSEFELAVCMLFGLQIGTTQSVAILLPQYAGIFFGVSCCTLHHVVCTMLAASSATDDAMMT